MCSINGYTCKEKQGIGLTFNKVQVKKWICSNKITWIIECLFQNSHLWKFHPLAVSSERAGFESPLEKELLITFIIKDLKFLCSQYRILSRLQALSLAMLDCCVQCTITIVWGCQYMIDWKNKRMWPRWSFPDPSYHRQLHHIILIRLLKSS